MKEVEVVFIGAGPANICGASYLYDNNFFDFIVIDQGKCIKNRNHNDSVDCVHGVGGAGLFSDGKFSFYPSSTYIYSSLRREQLHLCYQYLINKFPVDIPDFPSINQLSLNNDPKWNLKSYPSIYLNLKQRIDLINNLTRRYRLDKFMLETRVVSINKCDDCYVLKCFIKDSCNTVFVKTKRVVLGGGRFMPLFLKDVPLVPSTFKRFELGIRVEGPSNHPFYSISNNTDPKFIKYKDSVVFKTFCWCRNGETLLTNYELNDNVIASWSGRSDVIKTDRSNFGFNLVLKDDSLLNDIIKMTPFSMKLSEIETLDASDQIKELYSTLINEVYDLAALHNVNDMSQLNIMGPTIEGVGYYPETDDDLKIKNEGVYVTGDCSGKFRGIISSMLSGIYVSCAILRELFLTLDTN